MILKTFAACGLVFAALAAAPRAKAGGATGTGTLHVAVGNVRAAKGRVHIYLCTQSQFLKDCPITGDAPARVGTTMVTLTGLPPGRYAVQAFLDENGNGKIDQALFGIPKEGVGFSNDARIRLGPPKWTDAMFDTNAGDMTIKLNLRYFLGGDAAR